MYKQGRWAYLHRSMPHETNVMSDDSSVVVPLVAKSTAWATMARRAHTWTCEESKAHAGTC